MSCFTTTPEDLARKHPTELQAIFRAATLVADDLTRSPGEREDAIRTLDLVRRCISSKHGPSGL